MSVCGKKYCRCYKIVSLTWKVTSSQSLQKKTLKILFCFKRKRPQHCKIIINSSTVVAAVLQHRTHLSTIQWIMMFFCYLNLLSSAHVIKRDVDFHPDSLLPIIVIEVVLSNKLDGEPYKAMRCLENELRNQRNSSYADYLVLKNIMTLNWHYLFIKKAFFLVKKDEYENSRSEGKHPDHIVCSSWCCAVSRCEHLFGADLKTIDAR